MTQIEPDYDDAGWRHVVHDTRSLDCIGNAHDDCRFGDVCRCTCHVHGRVTPPASSAPTPEDA